MLRLRRKSGAPLHRQIYAELKRRILSGVFEAGRRLPPTRELARELAVSRGSVVLAYELLAAEGFLEARSGGGTRVAAGAGRAPQEPAAVPKRRPRQEAPPEAYLGYRSDLIDFRTGLPDLAAFPIRLWQALSRRALERITPAELAYGRPEGIPELRAQIARYLGRQRGLVCGADDVVVTAGTTQAIGLVGRVLGGRPKLTAVLEDPITSDIRRIVAGTGFSIRGVPVDNEGLITDRLPVRLSPAFVYVTPSHHFPLGGRMPIQRRLELVRYCRDKRAWIVEDDYDSEYRFDGPSVSTLKELDPERVVYIGSFSKTVFPALRLAFLVLPAALVQRARREKWFTDLHNPVIEQKVLAAFIRDGHFERHILKSRRRLAQKRAVLCRALIDAFGPRLQLLGTAAGLHLAARWPGREFGSALVARLESAGVKVYPASLHSADGRAWGDTLLFGYGMLSEARLRQGVRILAELLERPRPSS